MKRIAVFCGSKMGNSPQYKEAAAALGSLLAKEGIDIVYGGASVGTMGALADSALQEGGKVIGVIPRMLEQRELAHQELSELHVVESMHERKAKMEKLADGFIALPGGPGTLEELAEIFTWAQLGAHRKPVALLNVNHYYDHFLSLFAHMHHEGFLEESQRSMLLYNDDPEALLESMRSYQPTHAAPLIDSSQT
ncbi:hypothetical protein ATL39_1717 [Sinobaca qinghaiensis]|uniref:Cytokinin riboside 5'-monophosphate phosphoribohydrolase n=1 Tax=Sinobaca qinghaiensis TaxID=342944 RepID=A0A419V4K5_9BACL|nr:TIGR00730 family Rossman fold protein [Sinobaca qinghaiensis]RKD73423.1 hypothetical protein ATL39_1717 [Sinobaca qinghaiensis]